MARKPGTHVSTIYALKSPALGKYIHARAWESDGPHDYRIRYLSVAEKPVSIAKSAKTAARIHAMLPSYLSELVGRKQDDLDHARARLDKAIASGNVNEREYRLDRVKDAERILREIQALMSSPIDVMRVVTTTDTTEDIV